MEIHRQCYSTTLLTEEFQQAWESGAPPIIDDFLSASGVEPNAQLSLLFNLVAIDLEQRWRSASQRNDDILSDAATMPLPAVPTWPRLEDYLCRFSELGAIDALPMELICEEYRVRRRWGDRPTHDHYFKRFPKHLEGLKSGLAKIDAVQHWEATEIYAPRAVSELDTRTQAVHDTSNAEAVAPRRNLPATPGPFGDYESLVEIARGGMGIVYKARQKKANRFVALKMILGREFSGEQDVKRFYSEAEAAAKLDHPSIVPIYDVGECGGNPYFTMGFVEGQSLKQRVADGPLPPREAAEMVKSIAFAIHYAHEQGVIHRDLKPANILLDRSNHPRITDFGLAKNISSNSDMTRTGQVMGTPSYMPPEQASGNISEVGPQSDVYSLGAVLYELLTGRPPFQAATTVEVLRQVLEQEPVSPRRLNAAVEADLETVCLKCLEKRTNQRYATAAELAAELDRYLRYEPIQARPISHPARAWRWCKRNPVVSRLSAVAVLALVAGTVVSVTFGYVANQRAAAERLALQKALISRMQSEARLEIALDAVKKYHSGITQDALLAQAELRPLRDQMVAGALEFYARMERELKGAEDLESRRQLAKAYLSLSGMLLNLGNSTDAITASQNAVDTWREVVAAKDSTLADQADFVNSINHLALANKLAGRIDFARQAYADAIKLAQKMVPQNRGLRTFLADSYLFLGGSYQESNPTHVVENVQQAISIWERLVAEQPGNETYRTQLVSAYNVQSEALMMLNQPNAAKDLSQRAKTMVDALAEERPETHYYGWLQALISEDMANASPDDPNAPELRQFAEQRLLSLCNRFPNSRRYVSSLAAMYLNRGMRHQKAAETAEAITCYNKANDFYDNLLQLDPQDFEARQNLATLQRATAVCLIELEQFQEALQILEDVLATDADVQIKYLAACGYSMAAKIASAEGAGELAESHAKQAAQLIYDVHELGFFKGPNILDQLRQEPQLSFIVDRLDADRLKAKDN